MNIKLLGQGYEATSTDSVGNQLITLFANRNFHSFTGLSAFASQPGIRGLSTHIAAAKRYLNTITIVTGVDQKGTSKEALEELLSLDIDTYIYYQPSFTIFHPKIYLFEGDEKSELIIGSSNLTSQGLFSNVEASMLVSIDNSVESDKEIVNQLKNYFKGIFDFTDPNLKRISPQIIADLVKAKVVPTEEERKAAYDKESKTGGKAPIIISQIFPKRAIAKIPKEFRKTRKSIPKVTAAVAVASTVSSSSGSTGALVWESGELRERDLNIPTGSKTNPTGSMLFKKGKTKGIDQRNYFRNKVFGALKWTHDTKPQTAHLERAVATFQILINGKKSGTFNLTITHNSKTDTAAYKQKNSMTQISWGPAKKIIAKRSLIGKNASLYKTQKPDKFILSIQ